MDVKEEAADPDSQVSDGAAGADACGRDCCLVTSVWPWGGRDHSKGEFAHARVLRWAGGNGVFAQTFSC